MIWRITNAVLGEYGAPPLALVDPYGHVVRRGYAPGLLVKAAYRCGASGVVNFTEEL